MFESPRIQDTAQLSMFESPRIQATQPSYRGTLNFSLLTTIRPTLGLWPNSLETEVEDEDILGPTANRPV
jgi:hypothetical protein